MNNCLFISESGSVLLMHSTSNNEKQISRKIRLITNKKSLDPPPPPQKKKHRSPLTQLDWNTSISRSS